MIVDIWRLSNSSRRHSSSSNTQNNLATNATALRLNFKSCKDFKAAYINHPQNSQATADGNITQSCCIRWQIILCLSAQNMHISGIFSRHSNSNKALNFNGKHTTQHFQFIQLRNRFSNGINVRHVEYIYIRYGFNCRCVSSFRYKTSTILAFITITTHISIEVEWMAHFFFLPVEFSRFVLRRYLWGGRRHLRANVSIFIMRARKTTFSTCFNKHPDTHSLTHSLISVSMAINRCVIVYNRIQFSFWNDRR